MGDSSRPDIWEDCQITGCVLFGSGKTRRCGADLSPIELPTTNKLLCLFPSTWTVSIYFQSFIENSCLKFICSHFPEHLNHCRLSLPRASLGFRTATVAAHNSALPRESVSGDKDGSPVFLPTCLDIKRVRLKPLSLETCHLPCLFLVPLLGVCAKSSYQTISQVADQKSVFPISLMSKWPRLQWKELVSLLQPSRPECFTRWSQGPTQLPRRPGANEALLLLAASSLRLGSSMLSFRLSDGYGVMCPTREEGWGLLALGVIVPCPWHSIFMFV